MQVLPISSANRNNTIKRSDNFTANITLYQRLLKNADYELPGVLNGTPLIETKNIREYVPFTRLPDAIGEMEVVYRDDTIVGRKNVTELLDRLYNMANDKEIVFDANYNFFYIVNKASFKQMCEQNSKFTLTPLESVHLEHGIIEEPPIVDGKQYDWWSLDAIFKEMINALKKYDKNPAPSTKVSDTVPEFLLDHKIFNLKTLW